MDIRAIGTKIAELIKKYKYVVLVLVIGIALMLLPEGSSDTVQTVVSDAGASAFDDPTEELTEILSQIQGAGEVRLMLTLHAGEKTVYQTDQDQSSSDTGHSVRIETVIVTDADRTEQGLKLQVLAPEYRGAVVVCQGADDAAVRLAIVEAVANATGLGTDRISVLKMK